MAEPTVLLEKVSPFGDRQAIVEADERVTFFYLFHRDAEAFPMRSCWVCNLKAAPEEVDVEAMRRGDPPMLPAEFCMHPEGRSVPLPGDLRVVWLESGEGAALLERDEIVAVIPPWSGYKGFHGYARDCRGESPICWQLSGADALIDRIGRADAYWRSWDDPDHNPWRITQEAMTAAAEAHIGKHSNYYAIDGGEWPPKALVRIPHGDRVVLLTIGVSICEQPAIEMDVNDPSALERIEFGAVLPASTPDDEVKQICSYMSSLTRLPWWQNTWLGHGHTVGCDAFPQSLDAMSSVLLVSHPNPFPGYQPVAFNGEPITMLWMVPISRSEQALSEKQGSAVLLGKLGLSVMEAFCPRDSSV